MLLLQKGETQSATVYFEEALRLNNVQLAVTRSLEELIKIHIKIKDYYQAAFQISRASHLNLNRPYLQGIFDFVEGVVDSIKKRYKDSLEKLKRVLELLSNKDHSKNCSYSQLIQDNIHLYLGYSYFCSQQYKQALLHYNKVGPPHSETPSFQYNKCLCEGILKHSEQKFAEAASTFEEAKKHMPNRV